MSGPPPSSLAYLPAPPTADFGDLLNELVGVVVRGIQANPRAHLPKPGPSEVGCPCARRLAYKLANVPGLYPGEAAWRPEVGRAVHERLAEHFISDNRNYPGSARWLVEFKLRCGKLGDDDWLEGSCDLYDRATDTVIDHKIMGDTALKRLRKEGASEQYDVQLNEYGAGWVMRGLRPRNVAIFALPMAGELSDAHLWHAPFRPELADKALVRLQGIRKLVDVLGTDAPAALPTADAHCAYCPWFLPAVTDLREACPGHPGARVHHINRAPTVRKKDDV